ncbi:type I-C CRISPR-associated protein Cas7/Csd2 [Rubellimicrobium rubrum]|uniref:Type I-C CRISPR-associated protein Cas7/Csd2 n=1 Tax=Rubellimicrobium rubrum TaxID=2585369 RepID=A0A5C4MX41_9RHOB|nr:type I-C CRISPR-associated protein Cas7/Csd2 [Rubellimicrobium rubrum]TNC49612.1 type I-C CRISPR-associated protein Cas7/Csd2 [Rubellimicrobium rubrum]
MSEPLARRIDLVLLFDVTNGNPNGDPDAGNMPRMDPETGHGLVTDVCLKRKVRNYVELTRQEAGHHIYVSEGAVLNDKHRQAYAAVREGDASVAKAAKLTPKSDEEARRIRDWMCANFWDIRAFGGVLSTGINAGQVRGPVQFAFGRSIEPVLPLEVSITRMAATNEKEKSDRAEGEDASEKRGDKRTMGRKHVVPYGLYRSHGFVSAGLANKTGFAEADYELLLAALAEMFEHDRSAARGEMGTRALIAFEHDNSLGRAPAHSLFDRVRVGRQVRGEFMPLGERTDNLPPARAFSDYAVAVDMEGLPEGVSVRQVI